MAFTPEYQNRYAAFLIRLAWTVEIIAVLIGLTISVVVSVASSTYGGDEQSFGILGKSATVLVAALPFVLVAVVELCKIPLVFAFMAVSNFFWRAIFAFSVGFLCIITFETMLNGFERNFSNLNYQIDTRKNEIERLQTSIERLEDRKKVVWRFTEEDLNAEADERSKLIRDEFANNVHKLDERTDRNLAQIKEPTIAQLREEANALREQLEGIYEQWNMERSEVESRVTGLIDQNVNDNRGEKDRLLAERDALEAEMEAAVEAANFFTSAGVEREYQKKLDALDARIAAVNENFLGEQAMQQQSNLLGQLSGQVDFINQKYQMRIDEQSAREAKILEEIEKRETSLNKRRDSVLTNARESKKIFQDERAKQQEAWNVWHAGKREELAIIMAEVNALNDEIFELETQMGELGSTVRHLIFQNQVYRLAMYVEGVESPDEVPRQTVGTVALIWFGSLACIASFTGVLLALAGFYLRKNAARIQAEEA